MVSKCIVLGCPHMNNIAAEFSSCCEGVPPKADKPARQMAGKCTPE
jgi:hypothetical protein